MHDDPELRRRIQGDLDAITAVVRDGDPHLKALVLTGGFARGEGTAIDGQPQNDYDLVAVRDLGRSRPYTELAQEAADRTGLHVDLAPVWQGRLPWLPPSIFWYETAARGRVLWGDAAVLRRVGIRDARNIAPREGVRLLANRAAGLLLYRDASPREKRIQACKALLAALDVHLLARGDYRPTHRERWLAYHERRNSGDRPATVEKHRDALAWAYRFKTWPADAPPRDADTLWEAAADAVLDAIPAALRHAGLPDVAAAGRLDTWPERVYYWLRAPSIHARRWVLHPSSRVRVGTLQLLQAQRNGMALPRPFHPLVSDDRTTSTAMQDLRRATLQ